MIQIIDIPNKNKIKTKNLKHSNFFSFPRLEDTWVYEITANLVKAFTKNFRYSNSTKPSNSSLQRFNVLKFFRKLIPQTIKNDRSFSFSDECGSVSSSYWLYNEIS